MRVWFVDTVKHLSDSILCLATFRSVTVFNIPLVNWSLSLSGHYDKKTPHTNSVNLPVTVWTLEAQLNFEISTLVKRYEFTQNGWCLYLLVQKALMVWKNMAFALTIPHVRITLKKKQVWKMFDFPHLSFTSLFFFIKLDHPNLDLKPFISPRVVDFEMEQIYFSPEVTKV